MRLRHVTAFLDQGGGGGVAYTTPKEGTYRAQHALVNFATDAQQCITMAFLLRIILATSQQHKHLLSDAISDEATYQCKDTIQLRFRLGSLAIGQVRIVPTV